MDRRTYLTTACGAALTTVAGCLGGDDGGGEPAVSDENIAQTISITGEGYDPALVEISAGEGIEWINETNRFREVVSVEPSRMPGVNWDFQERLSTVEEGNEQERSTRHLFEEAGYYWFYDDLQTRFQMCGVVVVDEDPSEVEDFDCRVIFA